MPPVRFIHDHLLLLQSYKFGSKIDGDGNDVQASVKQLVAIADRLECTPNQLMLAWSVRNQTSQCTVLSASSVEQLRELLASVPVSWRATSTNN